MNFLKKNIPYKELQPTKYLKKLNKSNVEGHYRSRSFDELLVTVYCNEKEIIDEIFKEWFMANNDLMAQEAFSYEMNDK
ncbi:hypothetical protein [uncultured Methanobrevibacter sp.]|uniref:hypothetical protein n=1 Tax=uncultured Methanobrevibacter sp. TaxID=253161 RepID=UPI0025CFC86B|nr:hypothetical protein [uncultured Methanobrevibacter sp.]